MAFFVYSSNVQFFISIRFFFVLMTKRRLEETKSSFTWWSAGGEILLWRAVENAENKPSWKVLRTLQWVPDCLSALPVLSRSTIRCIVILLPELVESWGESLQRGHGVSLFLFVCRLHLRDVLDLAWSPDSMFLMSGSVDNQCMIWDVSTGTLLGYHICRVDYLSALRLLKSH